MIELNFREMDALLTKSKFLILPISTYTSKILTVFDSLKGRCTTTQLQLVCHYHQILPLMLVEEGKKYAKYFFYSLSDTLLQYQRTKYYDHSLSFDL